MSNILPIKLYPDPILRKQSKELTVADLNKPEIQQLILDMEETMHKKDGIGLAAPQVGQSVAITVIKTDKGVLTLVNPKISKKSWKKELGEEGCLSFPDIYGMVKRPIKIAVKTLNAKGEKVDFEAAGLFARVVLHEVDHLNGVLFVDKVKEIIKGQDKLENMKHVT